MWMSSLSFNIGDKMFLMASRHDRDLIVKNAANSVLTATFKEQEVSDDVKRAIKITRGTSDRGAFRRADIPKIEGSL